MGSVFVLSSPAAAQTVADLQSQIQLLLQQIANLEKQLAGLEAQSSVVGSAVADSYCFNRDLYYGLENDPDVTNLQKALSAEGVYGGPVTGNFFSLTRSGVIKFQKKYNFNPIPDTGYVGLFTRNKLNDLHCKAAASSAIKPISTQEALPPAPAPTVTAKADVLSLITSVSPQTTSLKQNNTDVAAGTAGFPFTQFILDASGSTKDIHVSSISPHLSISLTGIADDLTNCQLVDGNLPLNTGGRVVNPLNTDGSGVVKQFVFDNTLIIPAGTIKYLNLKCNVFAGATEGGIWQWGILADDKSVAATTASGAFVNDQVNPDSGRHVKLAGTGTLSVTLDPSTPALRLAQAGSVNESLAVLGVYTSGDSVRLDRLGLQLSQQHLNTPNDLSGVSVWTGPTKVGQAFFTSDYATVTLSNVIVPKNGSILLTIKGDVNQISVGFPARSGHLVKIDYDADNSSDEINLGLSGTSLNSGVVISAGGSYSISNGARLVKAIPKVQNMGGIPASQVADKNNLLSRFSVTAPAATNGISLYKFAFDVALASGQSMSNLSVYCYSDSSFSIPSCGSVDGKLNNGGLNTQSISGQQHLVQIRFNPTSLTGGTPEAIRIPAGGTRYFAFRADVTGGGTAGVKLLGDAEWQKGSCDAGAVSQFVCDELQKSTYAHNAATVDKAESNFIWSDNPNNTVPNVNDYVWMNGFLVPGLPAPTATAPHVINFTVPAQTSAIPPIQLLSPNGGETFIIGQAYQLEWAGGRNVDNNSLSIGFQLLSEDGNTGYDSTKGNLPQQTVNDGVENWLVANVEPGKYRMRILCLGTAATNKNCDYSSNGFFDPTDAPFTIVAPAKSLDFTFPIGGETLERNKSYTFKWNSTGDIPKVDITVGQKDAAGNILALPGINNTYLAQGITNTGSYTVTIPNNYPLQKINIRITEPTGDSSRPVDDVEVNIVGATSVTNDTDLYVKTAIKSGNLFYLTVCMNGSKSMNDIGGFTSYPVGYAFTGSNGAVYTGTNNVAGTPMSIKNGQCASYYTSLWTSHQPYFTETQNVTFTADQDNKIVETNETNNSLVWKPSSADSSDASAMASILASMQALLDEIAKAISGL